MSLGYTHILMATDGSPPAATALQHAVALATALGARLTLLHVAMVTAPASSFDPPWKVGRAEAAARLAGQRILEEARAAADLPCATELHFGDPPEVICRRVRELGVDLLVLGNSGRGALDRLVLGSVSSAVVQRAPCSVLVVRQTAAADQAPPRADQAAGADAAEDGLPPLGWAGRLVPARLLPERPLA